MIKKFREKELKEEEIVKEAMKKNEQDIINKVGKEGLIKFETYISPEEKQKINEEFEKTNEYSFIKEKKIEEKLNNKKSKFKKVADYLYRKLYEYPMLNKKDICSFLQVSQGSLNNYIHQLNFCSQYPITIIPVRKKKGFIQAITKNEDDAEDWDKRKFRTIVSLTKIREKGNYLMGKIREKRRVEQKIKVSN